VLYPAAYENVLAVAASDASDRRASFSNHGPEVDLTAPGVEIYSTWYLGNYFTKSGTSMATPHVSGAAALIWSTQPTLQASQVISALLLTAEDLSLPGLDEYTGWGRLNLYHALTYWGPRADLWVSVDTPAHIQAGEPFRYTLRYGNQGPLFAPQAVLSATLPVELAPGGVITWSLGTLAASSGPFTLTVPVTATRFISGTTPLTVTSQAQISSPALEMETQNNTSRMQAALGHPAAAAFSVDASRVALGQPITFTNHSSGTLPLNYQWDFGDSSSSAQADPVHIYTQAGVYTVTLMAENAFGPPSQAAPLSVTVGLDPSAAFTASPDQPRVGQAIGFSSQSSGSLPMSLDWDFGDGQSGSGLSPSHAYARPGEYLVTLTVTNEFGQSQWSLKIVVAPARIYVPLAAASG
jgi:PKD repeat protein